MTDFNLDEIEAGVTGIEDAEVVTDITTTVDAAISGISELTITNDEEYEITAEWLKRIKSADKAVHAEFDDAIAELNKPYRDKLAERKAFLDKLGKGEKALKRLMADYQNAVRRKQAEEERKRQEEARKREEEERKANKPKIFGGSKPVAPPPPPAAPPTEAPKVAGTIVKTVVKWKTLDFSQVPDEYKVLDEKRLNKMASGMGMDAQGKVPGIEFYEDTQIGARG
jgi:hypothetical protein